jgi:hypothetical protein
MLVVISDLFLRSWRYSVAALRAHLCLTPQESNVDLWTKKEGLRYDGTVHSAEAWDRVPHES